MAIEHSKKTSLIILMALVLFLAVGCNSGPGSGPGPRRLSGPVSPPDPGTGPQATTNLTLTVVDNYGTPIVGGFRWLLELDTTYDVVPGAVNSTSLGVNIHTTYLPVIAAGKTATSSVAIPIDSTKKYYVSVLPVHNSYTNSGQQVIPGQTAVTVKLNRTPILTAQVSVLVFQDDAIINGAPDTPAEPGLPGFNIIINDMIGQVSKDAYNNPLGTTYLQNPDGSFVMDANGLPVVDQMGLGTVITDANGEAVVHNLPPNHYLVTAVPPKGEGWILTATPEGARDGDA